jgi:tRNA (adenine57-N1/adenine58-N1)-methyltransferase
MLLSSRAAVHEGRRIQEGDLIIIYESHDRMKAVQVSAKDTLQNRFGSFKHSDWIGKPFGSKVS